MAQFFEHAPISKLILNKIDFDFFTKYDLRQEAASKSESAMLELADAGSARESDNINKQEKIEKAAWQYILKTTIGELVIANQGYEETAEIDLFLEKPKRKPLRQKIEDGVRDRIFYEPTLVVIKEGLLQMIEYKISDNIFQIKAMLEATMHELQLHGTFSALKTQIKIIEQEQQIVHDFIFDYVKSVQYLKYLKAKQLVEEENFLILKKEWDEQAQILQETLDDCSIMNCIETRTIKEWTETRVEQREIIIDIGQEELNLQLDNMNTNYKNETVISTDIEEYLDFKISEVDGLIEKWMTKCDTEIEKMDEDIQFQTENVKLLEIRAQRITDEFNSHQEEMYNFWEKKRLEREAILLEQKKFKFAIIIQAWWRGTMVRRHLGPYRRRKRKGKKGKEQKRKSTKDKNPKGK